MEAEESRYTLVAAKIVSSQKNSFYLSAALIAASVAVHAAAVAFLLTACWVKVDSPCQNTSP
jgi:thiosulfate reductase cytochrome b subunit